MRTVLVAVFLAAAVAVVAYRGGDVRADLSIEATFATITVDGNNSDWAAIPELSVTLKQFEIPPGSDWEFDPVDPVAATVKVAADEQNIYVLFEVADDFDFVPTDTNLSASPSVMFLVDDAAGPHMGAGDDDLEQGLGMVDLWHWELECGAGVISGGGAPGSGNDPDCNLDDEFSLDPEERDDDGRGDAANPNGENSISGTWEHTNRASGPGAAGTWIFEFSRPLQTGDPEDAQFTAGASALMALAYFDPDESAIGWSDAGHLTSAGEGWIQLLIPGPDATQPPAATSAPTPATTLPSGGTPAPTASSTASSTSTSTPTPTPGPPTNGDSDVNAEITVSADPRVGDPADVLVTLSFAADGSPAAGALVRLLREVTFADVTGMVEVAAATTDEDGSAELTFVPRRDGNQELVIEYLMRDADEPLSTTATLTVADGEQIVGSESGLDAPWLGAGLLMALVAGIWLVLIILAIGVIAIARAGGPEEPEVGGFRDPGRLDAEARLSDASALDKDERLSEKGSLDRDERLSGPGRLEDDE